MRKSTILLGTLVILSVLGLLTVGRGLWDRPDPVAVTRGDQVAEATSVPALQSETRRVGNIDIRVTPRDIKNGASIWTFETTLDTHSVDLDHDLQAVVSLECDQGVEYRALAWEGAGPGGHHRQGVLQFEGLDHEIDYLELVFRDIDGIPETRFSWTVSNEAS